MKIYDLIIRTFNLIIRSISLAMKRKYKYFVMIYVVDHNLVKTKSSWHDITRNKKITNGQELVEIQDFLSKNSYNGMNVKIVDWKRFE